MLSISQPASKRSASGKIALALLVCGTILGLAGIDLVLPAVPALPQVFGSTPAYAQLVLASFAAGTGFGLIAFAQLGDRIDRRWLLISSFVLYGIASLACASATSIQILLALRFFQGAAGAAAAVFAPGIIRTLLPGPQAMRALGMMGSVESMIPAFAPMAGAVLLAHYGWQSSFWLTGVLALALAVMTTAARRHLPASPAARPQGSYAQLLKNKIFIRYALSHALTLGGLLTFVFGAPAVIVGHWQRPLADFIFMQMMGIAAFALFANLAQRVSNRWGAENSILFGSRLAAVSGSAILLYAVAGGSKPEVLTPLFIPMNIGLGLRAPPGFYRAVLASHGDDARAAALVILAVLGVAALGTAVVAPYITLGLIPLAIATALLTAGSVIVLKNLPSLDG